MIIDNLTLNAKNAKKASISLSGISTEKKNNALKIISQRLYENKEEIFKANNEDIERSLADNLAMPLIKRLKFDESKLNEVIDGINSLISLEDPIGKHYWQPS